MKPQRRDCQTKVWTISLEGKKLLLTDSIIKSAGCVTTYIERRASLGGETLNVLASL